jgi:hypothetical protein
MASNDLAGNNHRKVTSLSVPKVIVRLLHALGKNNDWVEAGEVIFDVALDSYSSPSGRKEGALSQAKFLAEQDEPTGRLRKLKIGLGKRGRALPRAFDYPHGTIRADGNEQHVVCIHIFLDYPGRIPTLTPCRVVMDRIVVI